MLGHINHIDPAATKHLEKRGLIEITDATVTSEIRCSICRECKKCKSQVPSYGRGGRSPEQLSEVIDTDIEGPLKADVMGFKYFQVFVDEASRDAVVDANHPAC